MAKMSSTTERPKKVGTFWVTEGYVHGPRQRDPDDFVPNSFRTLGKGNTKLIRGRLKKNPEQWAVQSYVRKIDPKEVLLLAKKEKHWNCSVLLKIKGRYYVSHSVYAIRKVAQGEAIKYRGRYYIRIIPVKGLYVLYRARKRRRGKK